MYVRTYITLLLREDLGDQREDLGDRRKDLCDQRPKIMKQTGWAKPKQLPAGPREKRPIGRLFSSDFKMQQVTTCKIN